MGTHTVAAIADPATWRKDTTGNMSTVTRNAEIQAARDARVCKCAHKNVSHGYGEADGATWPDGSRIGMGACGFCPCLHFD